MALCAINSNPTSCSSTTNLSAAQIPTFITTKHETARNSVMDEVTDLLYVPRPNTTLYFHSALYTAVPGADLPPFNQSTLSRDC